MKVYEATEQAYKNGYEAGKKDAVKHGRWITDHKHGGIHNCSVCGKWCGGGGCSPYCPNCGAKMDGDGNG